MTVLDWGDFVVKNSAFFSLACRRSVVQRSLLTSVVVGGVLIAINHGNRIATGCFDTECMVKSSLTMLVPYCVSTVSCVWAYMYPVK